MLHSQNSNQDLFKLFKFKNVYDRSYHNIGYYKLISLIILIRIIKKLHVRILIIKIYRKFTSIKYRSEKKGFSI